MKLLTFFFIIIVGVLYPTEDFAPAVVPKTDNIDMQILDAIGVIEKNISIVDAEMRAARSCLVIAKQTYNINNPICDYYIKKTNISIQATVIVIFMISEIRDSGLLVRTNPYHDAYVEIVDELIIITQKSKKVNMIIMEYDTPQKYRM